MAEDIFCKQLIAIYGDEKGFLAGSIVKDIDLGEDYHVRIEQCGIRTIVITNSHEVSVRDLYAVLSRVARLLMVFDGKFYKLQELKFSDSQNDERRLAGYASNLIRSRLSYFDSHTACTINDQICLFEDVFTKDLYNKWVDMLAELDIVHQVYLYSLSANRTTVDIKVSFLIELAEPIIELLKKKTGLYASLNPGERGTTLKMCLDALIIQYGQEIFSKEIETNYEGFLQVLVNSRVRIMHIKRNQKGIFFNGSESALYMMKISLLYRYILLSLLGVSKDDMIDRITKAVTGIDMWNDNLNRFLVKIRKAKEK